MKKILFVFIFSMLTLKSVFCMTEQHDTTKTFSKDQAETIVKTLNGLSERMEKLEGLDKSKVVSEKTKLQKIFSALGVVPEKAAQLANYVYSNLDKKGMLTMLCILTPIFALYCTFFPPEFLSKIAEWFGYWLVKSGVETGEGAVKGALVAFQEKLEKLENATMANSEQLTNLTQNAATFAGNLAGNLSVAAADGVLDWVWANPGKATKLWLLWNTPNFMATLGAIVTALGGTALSYAKLRLGLIKPS